MGKGIPWIENNKSLFLGEKKKGESLIEGENDVPMRWESAKLQRKNPTNKKQEICDNRNLQNNYYSFPVKRKNSLKAINQSNKFHSFIETSI